MKRVLSLNIVLHISMLLSMGQKSLERASQSRTVIALYPFEEADSEELSFGVGEVLTVLDAAAGWLRARNSKGVEGWIPGIYVKDTATLSSPSKVHTSHAYSAEFDVPGTKVVTALDNTAHAWELKEASKKSHLVTEGTTPPGEQRQGDSAPHLHEPMLTSDTEVQNH